nr:hypothetical protein [Lactobacillus gallinarum]
MSQETLENIIAQQATTIQNLTDEIKLLREQVAYLTQKRYGKSNVDILAVSQRLGHAKLTTTLKYYSQLWRGRNRTVADQLNGAIGEIDHPDHSLVDFNGSQFVAL